MIAAGQEPSSGRGPKDHRLSPEVAQIPYLWVRTLDMAASVTQGA